MKVRMAIVSALAMAASVSAVNADVIYQDNFDGTAGVLNGRTVTVSSGTQGGTAGATWTSDAAASANPDAVFTTTGGTYTTTGSTAATIGALTTGADSNLITNAYLPFVPTTGLVYDFHASLEVSSVGASGNWMAMAFTQAGLNTHTLGGGSSALSNDSSYGLLISKGSGVVQDFGGLNTGNGSTGGSVTAGVYNNFDLLLDTTGTNWKISWLVNGASAGSYTYGTNPSIGDVVFGTNKITGAVSSFSLTTAPEPASLGLLSVGAMGLLARRRRA